MTAAPAWGIAVLLMTLAPVSGAVVPPLMTTGLLDVELLDELLLLLLVDVVVATSCPATHI